MAKPKVSIIIPVYNTAAYLRKCLDSAVRQTLEDVEILVVDDASTDGSLQIIRDYEAKCSRVKVIAFPANQGNGYGRNAALQQAAGEYLVFLDSDDWLEPNALELAYAKAVSQGHDVVLYGHWAHHSYTGRRIKEKFLPVIADGEAEFFRHLLHLRKDLTCMPWQYLIASELVRKHQLEFTEGIYYEDFFFTIKLAYYTKNLGVVRLPLYHYRRREGSITASASKKKIADMFSALTIIKNFLQAEGVYGQYRREYLICFLAHGVCYNFLDYFKLSGKQRDRELDEYMDSLRKGRLVCRESLALFTLGLNEMGEEEPRSKASYALCQRMLGYLLDDYHFFWFNYRLAFWLRTKWRHWRELMAKARLDLARRLALPS